MAGKLNPLGLKEPEMQAIIFDKYKRSAKFILTNMYMFYDRKNECDMIIVYQNGEMVELEIKSARQDAVLDHVVKEEKHRMLSGRDPSCPNYYIVVAPSGVVPRETLKPGYGLWEIKADLSIRQAVRPKKLNNTEHSTCDFFQKIYYTDYFPSKKKLHLNKVSEIKKKISENKKNK